MTQNVMYCSNCGSENLPGGAFCQKCGTRLASTGMAGPQAGPAVAYQAYPAAPAAAVQYGGFWIRFLAIIIDAVIIRIAVSPIVAIFAMIGIMPTMMSGRLDEFTPAVILGGLAVVPILVCVGWLYEAILTSSAWQATVGKKILGLKVTDDAGNRISFARATGRHFAKILSGMIFCIGFIMAGFTERKRALHDMIAGTLVMKG